MERALAVRGFLSAQGINPRVFPFSDGPLRRREGLKPRQCVWFVRPRSSLVWWSPAREDVREPTIRTAWGAPAALLLRICSGPCSPHHLWLLRASNLDRGDGDVSPVRTVQSDLSPGLLRVALYGAPGDWVSVCSSQGRPGFYRSSSGGSDRRRPGLRGGGCCDGSSYYVGLLMGGRLGERPRWSPAGRTPGD